MRCATKLFQILVFELYLFPVAPLPPVPPLSLSSRLPLPISSRHLLRALAEGRKGKKLSDAVSYLAPSQSPTSPVAVRVGADLRNPDTQLLLFRGRARAAVLAAEEAVALQGGGDSGGAVDEKEAMVRAAVDLGRYATLFTTYWYIFFSSYPFTPSLASSQVRSQFSRGHHDYGQSITSPVHALHLGIVGRISIPALREFT